MPIKPSAKSPPKMPKQMPPVKAKPVQPKPVVKGKKGK